VRRAERVAEPAEREEAVVGVGALGEPGDEHRHEVPLDRGPTGDARREGADVRERALRVAEADRGEPGLGLAAREPEPARRQRRHRRQERAVEEPFVQAADPLPRGHPQCRQVAGGAGESRRAREHPQAVLVARHEVRAPQPGELQAVLEHPEDAVVARELGGLLAAHVPVLGQRREGRQGARLSDRLVARAVHELEQLHGELDVAQAARSELQLHVDLVGGDVLGDALAHALHGFHEAVAARARPHLGRDPRRVSFAELEVARERARLQQRLELPALGPPLVVLQVGVEGAHECAVLALGAEVRIDLPERRLDARFADDAHRDHGESRGDVEGARRRHRLLVGGCRDEDHVDIADVVELPGARLAHADDGQPGGGDLGCRIPARARRFALAAGDDASRDRDRRVEHGSGEIGESRRDGVDHLDRVGGAQVVGREFGEQAPVPHAHGLRRRLDERRARPGYGLGRRQEFGASRLHRARRRRIPLVHVELGGMPREEVGEATGRTDDTSEPRGGVGHGEQRRDAVGSAVAQAFDVGECRIGIGGATERLEQGLLLDAGRVTQSLECGGRPIEVEEPRASESAEGGRLPRHPPGQRISRLRSSSKGVTSER
jgi:hypothetical protein